MSKAFDSLPFYAHINEITKEPQLLRDHLKGTALYLSAFLETLGLPLLGELIGLLHDLGKYSHAFQEYLILSVLGTEEQQAQMRRKKGKIIHSAAGAQYVEAHCEALSPFVRQTAEIVILSHHGGLMDCMTPDGNDELQRRLGQEEQKSHQKEAEDNIEQALLARIKRLSPLLDSEVKSAYGKIVSAFGKGEEGLFAYGLLIRLLLGGLVDADRIDSAEGGEKREEEKQADFAALEQRLSAHLRELPAKETAQQVNGVRRAVSERCAAAARWEPGIYSLPVPTGGGKTLSALRFAFLHADRYHKKHILFIAPFTSIIEQNAEAVREALGLTSKEEVVLEYHSNLVVPEEEQAQRKRRMETFDAPVVFTTMVQFLESMFGGGTTAARKFAKLKDSVILLDEAQALPVKCVHLFNIAIRFLVEFWGCTVLLCTATQPLLDRVEPPERALPQAKSLVDAPQALFMALKRVEAEDKTRQPGWTAEELAELVSGRRQSGRSVLAVTNTRAQARRLYRAVDAPPEALFYLSTDLCPAHRNMILDKIKERLKHKKQTVCISTSLIEAGVDISFETVIRYLAGLDSIVQAAGRCNRNGHLPYLGEVLIVNEKDENLSGLLGDVAAGAEITKDILTEYRNNPQRFDGDILGVKAVERYFRDYNHMQRNKMCYPVAASGSLLREDELFGMMAGNRYSVEAYRQRNQAPQKTKIPQSFRTAALLFDVIERMSSGVIVPFGEGKEIIAALATEQKVEEQRKLLMRAQRYSVNCYANRLTAAQEKGIVYEVKTDSGIYALDDRYYTQEMGVEWDREATTGLFFE